MSASTTHPTLLNFVLLIWSCFAVAGTGWAQTTFCADDPPANPFLADSPWPTYHRNSYRQASTCLTGPGAGDTLSVRARTRIKGGTSPWIYLSDRYPSGERVMYYSNATHAFKFIDDGREIRAIDSLRIDFDLISSFGWNMLQGRRGVWYTYDPRRNASTRLFRMRDAVLDDPYSDIVATDTLDFADVGIAGRVQHFAMLYDGNIAFNAQSTDTETFGTFGVLSPTLGLLDTIQFAIAPGEITYHNAFPVAEDNTCYVLTTHRLLCFAWDGTRLRKTWEAAYDFVGDGPTGAFAEGSGTTPTLIGWGEGNDQLIVMADGHQRNNLVGFWRKLPSNWTGLPGQDPRFAGSLALPASVAISNTFQSIENSPTARGYSIALAQFNGFLGYECINQKGVQRATWDTTANRFQLDWVNQEVNLNGVLTYAGGSGLVYSSGKETDCNYYLYGLDWETGETRVRQLLGPEGSFNDSPFADAGNGLIIDERGTIYFAGGASIVAIDITRRPSGVKTQPAFAKTLRIWPNPARHFAVTNLEPQEPWTLVSITGEMLSSGRGRNVPVAELSAGTYILRARGEAERLVVLD